MHDICRVQKPGKKFSPKTAFLDTLPYSPELNLIEILWRFMKYHWMPFSAYVSLQCLLQSIEDILQRFGTDDVIDFEMK